MNKIKSLTWKYFLIDEYKKMIEDLKLLLTIFLGTGWFFGAMFVVLLGIENTTVDEGLIYTENWWAFIPIITWIITAIIVCVFLFVKSMQSNWDKAEKIANKDLRRNSKRRRS